MQYLLAKARCWTSGHIWCYDSLGPPIQDFGGAWYVCIRCTAATNRPWAEPLITKRDHGV